jgi:hypothetical protein
MDLLKKVKSATLIEALVATVLIVVVFVIASLILNNLLLNSFSKNTHGVETKLAELQYQASYSLISLPHNETFQNWNIKIEQTRTDKIWITLQAVNNQNKKEVIKTFLYEKQ